MTKDIILCKCHKQPVKSEVVKGKAFGRKYFCEVTGIQLFNNFIYAKMKVDINDDTRPIEDFKKRQGGDE